MPNVSEPGTANDVEKDKETSWIVRTLAGSVNGRIVMSSYQSLRAAGTPVVCLSPWGDSNPVVLPCIRMRDLVIQTVISATGGAAAIVGPVMDAIGDDMLSNFGDSVIDIIAIELSSAGAKLGVEALANDLFITDPVILASPSNDRRLATIAVKSLTITLKHKVVNTKTVLAFFRASTHTDPSLFSSVKDYFAIEKGWFSPYLFASGRRPDIPRTMSIDVVSCHRPFLGGDYQIGETLLKESTFVIALSKSTPPKPSPAPVERASRSHLHIPSAIITKLSRSRRPSPSPSNLLSIPSSSTTVNPFTPTVPIPRRMIILVLGIKPHRLCWSTCARPGESVMKYILLNGCPAIVVPVQQRSPLIAWDTLTLKQLHKIRKLPGGVEGVKAKGVVNVLLEYLGLYVDWERVVVPGGPVEEEEKEVEAGEDVSHDTDFDVSGEDDGKEGGKIGLEEKKTALRDAVSLLVAGAINSGTSREAKKAVDFDRAGMVMFRIP